MALPLELSGTCIERWNSHKDIFILCSRRQKRIQPLLRTNSTPHSANLRPKAPITLPHCPQIIYAQRSSLLPYQHRLYLIPQAPRPPRRPPVSRYQAPLLCCQYLPLQCMNLLRAQPPIPQRSPSLAELHAREMRVGRVVLGHILAVARDESSRRVGRVRQRSERRVEEDVMVRRVGR
ncbi:hypothetical protein MPH_04372 [Macrophomina phaseolina MS6]|uniref:Uncharacterized protein n=1 Tax=Macrophomina phaseolina (strain MS6) TaxID=1126212 RepID=K2R7M1_MACPH|nr:hypothetical protein MPH_04372 [Macrophomina phaseolina MS6]